MYNEHLTYVVVNIVSKIHCNKRYSSAICIWEYDVFKDTENIPKLYVFIMHIVLNFPLLLYRFLGYNVDNQWPYTWNHPDQSTVCENY
jgi:hypothetical protein